MESLELDWNHFSSIPCCVEHLRSLEVLCLQNQHPPHTAGLVTDKGYLVTETTSLPAGLLLLPHLKSVSLDYDLQDPPGGIRALKALGVEVEAVEFDDDGELINEDREEAEEFALMDFESDDICPID